MCRLQLGHNLADRLRITRHWEKINVGKQEPGDVGVCYSMANDLAGADHIYLVVRTEGEDKIIIVNNQVQGKTHPRFASGQGGKAPTEYFLRASVNGDAPQNVRLAHARQTSIALL